VNFNIFRNPFISQYTKAWQDGFDEGYRKAMSTKEDVDKEARAERIMQGIGKWEQDLDVAYWQGYNNAMVDMNNDWVYTNEDIDRMSTNGDNDAESNN